jgi:SAM-dependent methyltransferase
VLRLLGPRAGERILDVGCGPGELVRTLAGMGVEAVGVDASPTLIEAARERALADEPPAGGKPARFEVCDARELASLPERLGAGAFDAATCVLALMNMDPLEDVAAGVGSVLAPGGRFVAVVLHPAFRSPGMTSWGWAEQAGSATGRSPMVRRQYRRVDGYLGSQAREVVMNPGAVSRGEKPVTTVTHHRPLGAYVEALTKAGLLIEAMEEWASHRKSEAGPRAAEEDRARREIPMFLAIRAVKR